MTPDFRSLRRPLAAALSIAALVAGCATDPGTDAPSTAGLQVSDDPCAKTPAIGGGAAGATPGAGAASQIARSTDARGVGGAAIGAGLDPRRCALLAVAKVHDVELGVIPVMLPKGPLPAAAAVAAAPPGADARASSATPFAPGGDNVAAGLSVTLRDAGRQFAAGSDKLAPDAESLFRDIADQYSTPKQQARLTATSRDDERAAVEALRTRRILVVGHTDDVGGSADNASLSERRAAAVARVFQQEGVPAANLFFQGAGETLPVADNRSDDGRAANRRVEIVDVDDDATLRKFLATRQQNLPYYRNAGGGAPSPVAAAAPPAKGRKSAAGKGKPGFVDFGGVPASTLAAPADFGAGVAGAIQGPAAGAVDPPMAPPCSTDRPRVARGVKSLATKEDLPAGDDVPGLHDTSWSDTVNGHLIGLTGVAVARDGGAATTRPTLLVWRNYNPKRKIPAADFTTRPDVNVYRGSHAILYRVFAGGPMKCMDVLFPYTGTGDARDASLSYDRPGGLYVSTFELKSLNGPQ